MSRVTDADEAAVGCDVSLGGWWRGRAAFDVTNAMRLAVTGLLRLTSCSGDRGHIVVAATAAVEISDEGSLAASGLGRLLRSRQAARSTSAVFIHQWDSEEVQACAG